MGCVSDVPFTCVISTIGSFLKRCSAYIALKGSPATVVNLNICPFDPLELCGIAILSTPLSLILSIQVHKSSGLPE